MVISIRVFAYRCEHNIALIVRREIPQRGIFLMARLFLRRDSSPLSSDRKLLKLFSTF